MARPHVSTAWKLHPYSSMNSSSAPGTAVCGLYGEALPKLTQSGVPFLIGGAFALERYTGIARDTKDLDVFLRRRDLEAALAVFATVGCRTEITFPHWLAKAVTAEGVIDIIFSAGNGVAVVDDGWFEHAVEATVHLLRACAPHLDWARLLWRFGSHWRVLLSHLVLFGFIYPGERWRIPDGVMRELSARLAADGDLVPGERLCCGTFLSREQYLADIEQWGYADCRLRLGAMTAQDIARWTDAIDRERPAAAA